MPEERVGSLTRFTAADGRLVGLLVPASFDEFADHHPYDGRRSYVTDPELPLQVITALAGPQDRGSAHVHFAVESDREWPTRHKVVVCLGGAMRIHLSEADGRPCGSATLLSGDALMCLEGHDVEYLEEGSRMLEVKQGPYLGSAEADRHVLD